MGKYPGDVILFLSILSPSASSTGHDILLNEVLDQRFPSPKDQVAEEVVYVANLAFLYLQINPQSRLTMRQ
ncbi:hypothetical protein TorRG33x02_267460, partial [Trema orientale]